MDDREVDSLGKKEQIIDKISPDRLFRGNSFFVFVYKKTEKIILAIYLVTDFLKEEEPIKWKLRKQSEQILSDIIHFYTAKEESRRTMITARITHAISLLEIAEKSRLISAMNSLILREELAEVLETLYNNNSLTGIALPSHFFDIGLTTKDIKESVPEPLSSEEFYKGQIKGHEMSFNSTRKDGVKGKGLIPKDKEKNRKETILNIIKKSKEITIKDITEVITDCSEKTIQRDLSILVNSGVLKRTGERRWSKYQLA